ncbi:hypothetical protein DL98DRAFT_540942 [Cadophora sp. DSE1049]|nr:hypothetical protein DL98DRAFT_540942 [Cadophora sp. DSE1049]
MPLLYGEGEVKAFLRLREAIERLLKANRSSLSNTPIELETARRRHGCSRSTQAMPPGLSRAFEILQIALRSLDGRIHRLIYSSWCTTLRSDRKGKWVLILDNVDDASFLVKAQSTSRDGHTNSIGSGKLGWHDDGEDDVKLAAVLEFMPLAIVQAAAYVSQRVPRYSLRQYLQDFRRSDRKRNSLLNCDSEQLRRDRQAKNLGSKRVTSSRGIFTVRHAAVAPAHCCSDGRSQNGRKQNDAAKDNARRGVVSCQPMTICHGNPNNGWSKFECINEPGLPLSNKYIVQQPTLSLHSSTVTWLTQLMKKECFEGWAVHSCDGENKNIGGSWIEFSIFIVKR